MSFTAAIVGRPNVGKSTLFNRLIGARHALVDDTPGVTRDRRQGKANLAGLEFTVIDTAGLEEAGAESLQARMTAQTLKAIGEADVVLMVIDGRAGVTPVDKHFAKLVRKSKTPAVLIINKAESGKASATIHDSHALGLGEPVAISAEHGEGMVDLYESLAHFEEGAGGQESGVSEEAIEHPLQLAIVGRPNVGKSTLLNRVLGEERVLTGPEAGITRDAIVVNHVWEGTPIKLIDTAGLRRKSNITGKVEKLAAADTLHAIQFAQVVVLVIDATEPLEKQDNTIAALIEQEGRAMVIAVNKWDKVDDKPAHLKAIHQRLGMVLPQVKGIPLVPISAQTGYQLRELRKACLKAYKAWNTEISTGALNRWLAQALESHAPPLVNGRRIKIRYMTQKTTRPPTFILFANLSDIPEHYMRYLVNDMRESFNLPGVPIRLKIRKNKNPYAGKPNDRSRD